MKFSWFNTTEVDEFADSIASDLVDRFPPSEVEVQKRKGPRRYEKARDAIFARAKEFTHGQRLNIYKKARLGNRFKWALKEAEYPDEFVDALTYELTAFVTVESRKK